MQIQVEYLRNVETNIYDKIMFVIYFPYVPYVDGKLKSAQILMVVSSSVWQICGWSNVSEESILS